MRQTHLKIKVGQMLHGEVVEQEVRDNIEVVQSTLGQYDHMTAVGAMFSEHTDPGEPDHGDGRTMSSGYLDRRDEHTIYWEAHGAEAGVPVLVLHGGWGPLAHDGQYLDLARYDYSG